jgi:WD40 repeat protein
MQELRTLSAIYALSFSADGRYLAVSGVGERCVRVHDLIDGNVTDLPGHTEVYAEVAFAPRSDMLAVNGANVYRWHAATGFAERLQNYSTSAAAFDASGERLAYWSYHSGDRRPRLSITTPRNPVLPQVLRSWGDNPAATRLAWSPDGQWLGTGGHGARYNRIIPTSGTALAGTDLALPHVVYALAFRPDSQALAFATAVGAWVFSVPLGEALHHLTEHHGNTTGVAYTPEGRLLTSGTDSRVLTWDGISGRLLDAHDWRVGPLTALTVAPDGMRAAVGSKDGRIFLWDLD